MNPAVKRTRIKICGITRPEDAIAAVEAGADAIGLVFWQPSSRAVSVKQAIDICRHIPAFVNVVALTVDASTELIDQILTELPIDLLQFHGNESPEHCQQFNCNFIKALRMKPELLIKHELDRFSMARSILLDAYRKGVPGGTGESFDWGLIPSEYQSRIILAGGLTPENVGNAVATIRPYAVDVSGGVEQSAGIKDSTKIYEFIERVGQADRTP